MKDFARCLSGRVDKCLPEDQPGCQANGREGEILPHQSPEDKGAFIPAAPAVPDPGCKKKKKHGLLTEIRSFTQPGRH